MFKTKADVDKHVQTSFAKLRNEDERNLRGLTIAKCYANVGEYNRALHYVSTYLSIKSDAPQAYRLQGDCYAKLGKTELALQSYQTSLELAPNQPDLITNVCKLFLSTDLSMAQSKARHWCNQAKAFNLQNESVLNLNLLLASKETNGSNNGEPVEKLIKFEIIARPNDISLYIRLVKYYLDNGKIVDAFGYIYSIELKQQEQFLRSLDWQNTIVQMCIKFKQYTKDYDKNWKYWLMLISAMERQLFLNLCTDSPATHSIQTIITECVNLLFEFDQQLALAAKNVHGISPAQELAVQFLSHFRGQFCLHAATLLFKKELLRSTHWRETTRTALPLLLFAYNCGTVNTTESWLRNSTEITKKNCDLWNEMGAFRCAQAGRTLIGCIDESKANCVIANIRKICIDNDQNSGSGGGLYTGNELLTQIRKICSDNDWRKAIFKSLFNTIDMHKIKSSFFMQCTQLTEPTYELPNVCDLEEYEDIAQWVNPSSLSHIVYLSMGIQNDVDRKCTIFKGIQFSISNLMNCGAETLNALDIDTFLYATTLQTKRKLAVERNAYEFDNKMNDGTVASNSPASGRPKWLPYACLAHKLCTEEQELWWSMAYKIFRFKSISGTDTSDIRSTVQYGIETVRGIGGPKMDTIIALNLGKWFVQRAESEAKIERTFLEARADALYKYSLQQIKNNANVRIDTYRRYFKYAILNQIDNERELNSLAENAITYLAGQYIQNENYEECIDELSNIPIPTATYFQSQAYRRMNESKKSTKKNKRIYIEKAKECLNLTMALLDHPNFEKSHALKAVVNDDLLQLQQIQFSSSKCDASFHNDSNNVETFLNDSLTSVRHRRDTSMNAANTSSSMITGAVAVTNIQPQVIELENLVRKMMETLTLVRDEIVDVKHEVCDLKTEMNGIVMKLNNIEKKQDTQSNIDPPVLDDYFVIEDELNNQAYMSGGGGGGGSSSMYPNYNQQQRIQTPNQMLPSQMMTGATPSSALHQQTAALSAMNAYGNQFYNSVYPMAINNPYHTAMMSQPQRVAYHYPDQYGYGQPTAQLPDPRNSVIGLLTQPTTIAPPISMPLQQHQSLPIAQVVQPPPLSIVQPSLSVTTTTASQLNTTSTNLDKSNQSSLLRTWNSSYNNAPVEKTLPANVVITNSDPLPDIQHTTVTSQPALSVTIPSHHIKNNPLNTSLDQFAAQANLFANQNSSQNLLQTDNSSSTSIVVETPTKDNQQLHQQKSLFGGISFSSTPVTTPIQNNKTTSAEKNASGKGTTSTDVPKPFAQFSFGAAAQNDKPLNSIFSNLNRSSTAKTTATISKTAANISTTSNTSKEDVDDYVPTAQFEPVIALPELVEVKTGEEDEIVKFEHRAKLMRFVRETKEWKERGIGNIKVLVNKNDSNKVRLLMRRDQVLKLCCNQMLTKSTTFTVMPKVDAALTWYGQDYSENELQTELLAIRFKTVDVRKQFHDAILDAQKMMTDESVANATKGKGSKSKSDNKKEVTTNVTAPTGFGDKFKPIVGSWSCDSCYVTNNADSTICMSCKTVKSDAKSTPTATKVVKTKSNPKPVVNNGFGDQFKPKTGSWSCKQCYISNTADVQYCAACESPKDDTVPKREPKGISLTTGTSSKFSFGIPPATGVSTTAAVVTATTQSFTFGIPPPSTQTTSAPTTTAVATTTNSGFSFGTFTAMTTTNAGTGLLFGTSPALKTSSNSSINGTTTTTASYDGGFSFNLTAKETSAPAIIETTPAMLPPKESFSFVFKPKASENINKAKSPMKLNLCTEDVSDDENIEEENNTYFTPVIPLPDKIEVKTGEESEEVLYSHRAKLFRFADSEWKERGLGDVKILKHKETKKLRVVMRRDQILKICLNHILTNEIEYKSKDDKSWHFIAIDFSEGEVQPMQFCLRFKTKEIAQEFYDAATDAIAQLANDSANNSTLNDTTSTASVTDEPITTTKCQGCRGCNPDDFKFAEIKDINSNITDDKPLPLVMPPMQIRLRSPKTITFGGNKSSGGGGIVGSVGGPSKPTNKTSESVKNIFGSEFKNVNVSNANSIPSLFTQTSFTENNVADSLTKNIFGANSFMPTTVNKETNSIFSLTPVFGAGSIAPTTTTSTTNNVTSGSASSFVFGDAMKTISSESDKSQTSSASTFSFENTFANSCLATNKSPTAAGTDSNVFGGSVTKPFSIFGGAQPAATPVASIFGGAQTAVSPTASIFGGAQSTGTPGEASVFGGKAAESDSPVLKPPTLNTFSVAPPKLSTEKSLFDGTSSFTSVESSQPSIFGNALAPSFSSSQASSFTFTLPDLNNDGPKIQTAESVSKNLTNTFNSFTTTSKPSLTATTNIVDDDLFLKNDTGVSFASLAQTNSGNDTNQMTGFKTAATKTDSSGFFGLSTKEDFSSFQPKSDQQNKLINGSLVDSPSVNGASGGDDAVNDANYDPHYDAIIPLPDEIVVSTGEEEESKVFGERAKLFRYDATNKEWKERGVGELKILYHPVQCRYRLLMRREQIFKTVLNHTLNDSVQIQYMKNSDKAFCWATQNFSDDTTSGEVENLSVRFKNADIALQFDNAVKLAMEQLKTRTEIEPEED